MNRKLLRCTNLPIIPYNASYKPWAYTQLCKGFSVGKQKIFVSVKKRALVKPVMVKYRWWTTHRRPSQRCHEIVTWSLRTIIQFCFWGVVGCLLISRSDPYITTKNWCACGDFYNRHVTVLHRQGYHSFINVSLETICSAQSFAGAQYTWLTPILAVHTGFLFEWDHLTVLSDANYWEPNFRDNLGSVQCISIYSFSSRWFKPWMWRFDGSHWRKQSGACHSFTTNLAQTTVYTTSSVQFTSVYNLNVPDTVQRTTPHPTRIEQPSII